MGCVNACSTTSTSSSNARAANALSANTCTIEPTFVKLAGPCRLVPDTANQEPALITREPTIERLAVAQGLLLDPFGLTEAHLAATLAAMGEHRIDDADLYFQTTRHEGWSLEEGIVKSGSFSIDQGVGVRAVAGEKTAFAYSDDISLTALTSAAEATRSISSVAQAGRAKVARRGDG